MDNIVEITWKDDTSFTAHVTASDTTKKEADKAALDKIRKNKKVPGFRAGKIPDHIIISKFKDEFESDSLYNLIELCVDDVEKISGKRVYRIKKVENTVKKSDGIAFDLQCVVFPYIKIENLKDAIIIENIPIVEDSEIDEKILSVRRAFAVFEDKNDEVAEIGDKIYTDYEVWSNGNPSGTEKDFAFILGIDPIDKDIQKSMLEQKIQKGAEIKITKIFKSKDSGDEAQGMDIPMDFIFSIKKVERAILPPLDAELVKRYDPELTPDAEALKGHFRSEIEKEIRRKSLLNEVNSTMAKIEQNTQIFISDEYINDKINQFLQGEKDTSNLDEEQRKKLKESIASYEKSSLVMNEMYRILHDFNKGEDFVASFYEYIKDQYGKEDADYMIKIYRGVASGEKSSDYDRNALEHISAYFHNERLLKYFDSMGQVKKGKKISLADLEKMNPAPEIDLNI